MAVIWKYRLVWPAQPSVISMPVGAKLVHFAIQAGEPCVWAIVDGARDVEARVFFIVGTGHELPDQLTYRRTALDGPYVWHLFERTLFPITT